MNTSNKNNNLPLLAGMGASIIWGLSPAIIRILGESLGVFTSGMFISIVGGIFAIIYKKIRTGEGYPVNKKYWLICGGSYLIFTLTGNLAVGIAVTREQVISSGLFRLLWPLMTLILAVPINKIDVKKNFIGAVFVCVIGIILPNLDFDNLAIATFFYNVAENWFPSLLGLISSISWGIYSNYYSKYVKNATEDYIGVLMIFTGVVQLMISLIFETTSVIQVEDIRSLLFLILSTFTANLLWNTGMRSPYNVHVILFSNFIPILSTVLCSLILEIEITLPMLIGSSLIVIATIWSKKSIMM